MPTTIIVMTLIIGSSGFSQQALPSSGESNGATRSAAGASQSRDARPASRENPYASLFHGIPAKPSVPQSATLRRPAPERAVHSHAPSLERGPCGMPVIAARPDVDPKIVVVIPERDQKAARIVARQPPPCGS